MSGALEGVRVLELGVLMAGPLQGVPTEEIYGGLLGLADGELRSLAEEGVIS
jgi:hypothetical protein